MKKSFEGIIPPLVTPFDQNGEVSEEGLRRVMRYVTGNGCAGVFVGGSQGEFFSMRPQERIRTFEIAVDEAAGRYPVFAGTAAVTTAEAVELTQAAERAGCDAVSVINPYFITLNPEELYIHYKTIAQATSLPVLLYNNPDRTHCAIPAPVVERLARVENIIGMKDSSGDLTYVSEVLRRTEGFSLFCGKDTVIYHELLSGAAGAVPASANVAPRLVCELYQAVKEGRLDDAKKAQRRLAPLRNAFGLGSFPVVMKEALNLMGYQVGGARPPIQPVTPENRQKLAQVLRDLGLLES